MRWFLTLQAAFRRGLSDREAIEEANRTVPEALDPTLLPPEDAPEKQGLRTHPFLVTSFRARTHSLSFPSVRRVPVPGDPSVHVSAVHDSSVHDLIVPIGGACIANWPDRGDLRDEAVVVPPTCRSPRQPALDAEA